jgi:hypothetical protein
MSENSEGLAGGNGKALGIDHVDTSIAPNKPSKVSRQARSISASGPAELGEPFFSRERLGTFHKRFVARMLDAIASGSERVSPGVDKRPGTSNPRKIAAHPDRVLP